MPTKLVAAAAAVVVSVVVVVVVVAMMMALSMENWSRDALLPMWQQQPPPPQLLPWPPFVVSSGPMPFFPRPWYPTSLRD